MTVRNTANSASGRAARKCSKSGTRMMLGRILQSTAKANAAAVASSLLVLKAKTARVQDTNAQTSVAV